MEIQKEAYVKEIFDLMLAKAISFKYNKNFQFKLDIGTGYFFLSGFKVIFNFFKKLYDEGILKHINDPIWGTKAPIRIVMGQETNLFTKKILISIITNKLNEYNEEEITFLKKLIDEELLSFKVYIKKKFHIKLYQFYFNEELPVYIWSGSANFTSSGLKNNIELCSLIEITEIIRKLHYEFFNNLWKESTSDLNILSIINDIIEEDYIYLEPRVFFSKLFNLLKKDYLLSMEEETITDKFLLGYQNLSFYIVAERLQKFGGFILANSVGTGKSYIACQLMLAYGLHTPDKRCLLIVPKNVLTEWQNYLWDFELNDFVDLESMGVLQKPPYGENENYYFDYRNYANKYSLIVIDEGHNYRNKSNRRDNLDFIIKANIEAHVLILTATPINLSTEDLFSLCDLFYQHHHNIKKFEVNGLKEKYEITRRKVREAEDYDLNKLIIKNLRLIENELSIKISWRMIQEHFENDLKKLVGRDVKYEEPNVEEVTFTYPQDYKEDIFDDIIPFLKSLNFEPAKLWDGVGYRDEKHLIFWNKWQLYKRLESSIFAFYRSIENLYLRFQWYYKTISENKLLDAKKLFSDYCNPEIIEQINFDENRQRIILDTYISLKDKFPSDYKEKWGTIISNFEDDIVLIKKMLDKLLKKYNSSTNEFFGDSKLSKLKVLLTNNIKEGKPTIVFSQWKDTIVYLYNALKNEFDKLNFIHGTSKKSKDKFIREFNSGVFDIILTTDVLSEGVNLPRADSIINFDLPYNPVALVQRAGRALRITNPKKLFIKNFKPEKEIDIELELYEKLEVRLKTILDIIGLDFVIWLIDDKNLESIHERERQKYLDNYLEYKNKIVTTDPELLINSTLPEETKLDTILREAAQKYGINLEFLEETSGSSVKPFYTMLSGHQGFFLVLRIKNLIKSLGNIQSNFTKIGECNLTKEELALIDNYVNEYRTSLKIEQTSKTKTKVSLNKLIKDFQEFRDKFKKEENRNLIQKLIERIRNHGFLPQDIKRLTYDLKNLKIPEFIEWDDAIKDEDIYRTIMELTRQDLDDKVKIKALICYRE